MTPADLDRLIARVEGLSGGDREVDRELGLLVGGWEHTADGPYGTLLVPNELGGRDDYPDHPGSMYPALTDALDAVLELVQRKLPGSYGNLSFGLVPSRCHLIVDRETRRGGVVWQDSASWSAESATPALALLLAFLRALRAGEAGE